MYTGDRSCTVYGATPVPPPYDEWMKQQREKGEPLGEHRPGLQGPQWTPAATLREKSTKDLYDDWRRLQVRRIDETETPTQHAWQEGLRRQRKQAINDEFRKRRLPDNLNK